MRHAFAAADRPEAFAPSQTPANLACHVFRVNARTTARHHSPSIHAHTTASALARIIISVSKLAFVIIFSPSLRNQDMQRNSDQQRREEKQQRHQVDEYHQHMNHVGYLYRCSLPHGWPSATPRTAKRPTPSQSRKSSGRGSFALLNHSVDSIPDGWPFVRIDRHAAMMRIGIASDNHKLPAGLVFNRHRDGQLVKDRHALRHDGQLRDAWFHWSSSLATKYASQRWQ